MTVSMPLACNAVYLYRHQGLCRKCLLWEAGRSATNHRATNSQDLEQGESTQPFSAQRYPVWLFHLTYAMIILQLREDAHHLLDFTDNLSQHPECLTKPETRHYMQEMSELTENMSERLRVIQAIIHQDASTCRMDRPSKDNGSTDPGIAPCSSSAGRAQGGGRLYHNDTRPVGGATVAGEGTVDVSEENDFE